MDHFRLWSKRRLFRASNLHRLKELPGKPHFTHPAHPADFRSWLQVSKGKSTYTSTLIALIVQTRNFKTLNSRRNCNACVQISTRSAQSWSCRCLLTLRKDNIKVSVPPHWAQRGTSRSGRPHAVTANVTNSYKSQHSWKYLCEYGFGTEVFILGEMVGRKKPLFG